jgi:hypothetical protein
MQAGRIRLWGGGNELLATGRECHRRNERGFALTLLGVEG